MCAGDAIFYIKIQNQIGIVVLRHFARIRIELNITPSRPVVIRHIGRIHAQHSAEVRVRCAVLDDVVQRFVKPTFFARQALIQQGVDVVDRDRAAAVIGDAARYAERSLRFGIRVLIVDDRPVPARVVISRLVLFGILLQPSLFPCQSCLQVFEMHSVRKVLQHSGKRHAVGYMQKLHHPFGRFPYERPADRQKCKPPIRCYVSFIIPHFPLPSNTLVMQCPPRQ